MVECDRFNLCCYSQILFALLNDRGGSKPVIKVLVLGGDGFCGWPTALSLSAKGYDVLIVDNCCRREIDDELGNKSLTPITSLKDRLRAWHEVSGREIRWANIDIASDYEALRDLFDREKPDAIVHLAEQRSVPYSMSSIAHRRYTIEQNLGTTHNVLAAHVECRLDAHIVHLSSVGIYGYETLGYRIPDGYVNVILRSMGTASEREILHPYNPVSIYHLTKAQDQLLLNFYCKNDGIRATELVQGTVWGTQTSHTILDERLINRFDYDAIFGTVLNRFVLQVMLGQSITVYGSGEQTRAFIHISDTVRCIELALANPPEQGSRLRVLNQLAETRRIVDLAATTTRLVGNAKTIFLDNPRNEPVCNELDVSNDGLSDLGFVPKLIDDNLLAEIGEVVKRYAFRCDEAQLHATA
jgi:UDP-sulfoquinovose synthase